MSTVNACGFVACSPLEGGEDVPYGWDGRYAPSLIGEIFSPTGYVVCEVHAAVGGGYTTYGGRELIKKGERFLPGAWADERPSCLAAQLLEAAGLPMGRHAWALVAETELEKDAPAFLASWGESFEEKEAARVAFETATYRTADGTRRFKGRAVPAPAYGRYEIRAQPSSWAVA